MGPAQGSPAGIHGEFLEIGYTKREARSASKGLKC